MFPHHLSTEEAQKQGLFGSDIFRFSHLLYRDPTHRDFGVVHLNHESYKAFLDTIIISQRYALRSEDKATEEWLKAGGIESGMPCPWGTFTFAHMDYKNYENLKIACGFELHLKARLLSKDFVIHQINEKHSDYKSLAEEQKNRPICKSELFSISSYRFDEQRKQNYLPGLKDTSLNFGKLTGGKLKYKKVIDLPGEYLNIIDDYRNLRNQIHLPGDGFEARNIQHHSGSIVEFIIDFVNTEIVAFTNKLVKRNQLNYPLLTEFL